MRSNSLFAHLLLIISVLLLSCPSEKTQVIVYDIDVVQPTYGGSFTVQAGNSVPGLESTQAAEGITITLSAEAADNFSFNDFWISGAKLSEGGGTVRTFIMPANSVTVRAEFLAEPYPIHVNQPEIGGIFTVKVGSFQAVNTDTQAAWGQNVSLASISSYGYKFVRYIIDGAELNPGSGTIRSFTMPGNDVFISVEFEWDPNYGEPPTLTRAQEGLGVYVWDLNPAGNEFFAQWVGLDIKFAEDFVSRESWDHMMNDGYGRAASWRLWKAAKPGRRFITTIPPFPQGGIPGSWGGEQARHQMAGTMYQQAANGDYNEYYRAFGEMLMRNGLDNTIIRFGHEMSGDWYAWSIMLNSAGGITAQQKQDYFAESFRQFVTTLRQIPGQNFKFCWNPNTGSSNAIRDALIRSYPGNDYVDYIAFDQYDWWTHPNGYPEAYFNSDDPAFRRSYQITAWNNMVNLPAGMNWFANFAKERGKPLAIAEWGLWHQGSGNDWRQGGRDNPYFIEKMFEWINDNDVAWHVYFMFGDVSHSLYDTLLYPRAIEKFLELWHPNGATQIQPAISPVDPRLSAYNPVTVKPNSEAVLTNAYRKSDPWAFSNGLLAAMWTRSVFSAAASVSFNNCPASDGFALVYQGWNENGMPGGNNNLTCALYVNDIKIQDVTLRGLGRGWGDSYGIIEFNVPIPANATVKFQADSNHFSDSRPWADIKLDYIVFK